MRDLRGKIALITGAASGIGLGIARACVDAGMRVVMTDVREPILREAASALRASGADVLATQLDVSDRKAWASAAERICAEVGEVDLLCSNAGVNFVGATHEATYEDWDFALGVNVGGAINAVRTFVPRMVARKIRGHVVITSSVSGLFTNGGAGVYVTSKFALVGLAESLRADLRRHEIGVSVVCPGPVKSQLFESTAAVRPSRLKETGSVPIVPAGTARESTPIYITAPTGEETGRRVIEGVRRNAFYIMTHPEIRPVLEARSAALLAALPDEPVERGRVDASAGLLDASLYK
ncbi:MAG: ligN [Gammaproteobacteria bacterium]|jgi:NAD(P)-dependent dehydrogenase (short-subunit alcohol dehydrogenase family)|nr:ligN [Gammaproteobacteria bacterium]